MATFKITWPHGSEIVVQSDCHTVEQYINCRFGGGIDISAFNAEVELIPEEQAPASEEQEPVAEEQEAVPEEQAPAEEVSESVEDQSSDNPSKK